MSFDTQKNLNTDLLIGALDMAVFIAPKGLVEVPTNYAVQSGANVGDLAALPAGLVSVGALDKKANPKLATSLSTTPVETYGLQSASRIIRKGRDTTVDITMQETNIRSVGLYWGQDFTGTYQDPETGEVHLVIAETAFNQEYVAVLIGQDGPPGEEIYTIWDSHRATLSKSGDITATDDGILVRPATLQFLFDSDAGYAVRESYAGMGWKGELATKAGFGPEVTAITVAPSTATLAVGATRQLTVTDSNGTNVTAQATYTSANPARATVSNTGLVTGVATGAAVNITATYGGFSATCAVTVS